MGLTREFLQERSTNFSENPGDDQRETKETTVSESCGFLGYTGGH